MNLCGKSWILGEGDILVLGNVPSPRIGNFFDGKFDLTDLTPLGNEKVRFWWILGQGDILVMGDLSWGDVPPRIGNILYGRIDLTNLAPPPPPQPMKKLDFGSR